MWYVYLLLCNDDSIYTGITSDLSKRLLAHKNKTAAKYTAARGAKKFIYTEEFKTKGEALKREFEIKKLKRSQKLLLTHNSRS